MKYDPRKSTLCRECCKNIGQPFLCGECQWKLFQQQNNSKVIKNEC